MPKHVCFITPPSPFLLDERVFPSLGILKVAAAAEQSGHRVEHLDLNGVSNYEDAVIAYCKTGQPDVFAITATTPQTPAVTKIRYALEFAAPDSELIIGGPHPTLVHAAYRNGSPRAITALKQLLENFTIVVAGDGEIAIKLALSDVCDQLLDGDDPKGNLFLSAPDLAESPLPARHLVDLDSYHYSIDGIRVTPLIGQLGCPFGCNFCAGRDSAMLRRVRLRPTAHVIDEMRQIYNTYSIHGFMFFDDELNVNRQVLDLLKAIADLQDELKVEFRCRGFIKAELFTHDQAQAMVRAGFRRIMCGFESGSEKILKNINKNATKDDNTRAMEISHRYGLEMKALMSIGHPGESGQTVMETVKWLLQIEPADFDITIITAYPGSPYYDRAERCGELWRFSTNGDHLYMKDIDYTETEDFYKGSLEGYKSYVSTDDLTADEIVQLRDHAERTIRRKLNIPFYQASPALRFEASMGQLPGSIYRRSHDG